MNIQRMTEKEHGWINRWGEGRGVREMDRWIDRYMNGRQIKKKKR